MSRTVKFRLKHTAAKKLREQLYLGLFFAFVIWVLMAFLFASDSNPQTIIIYLVGSLFIVPYIYKKHIKPYFNDLADNVQNAFLEIDNNTVTYKHFNNVKHFDRQQIEFQIAEIVNLKKSFRKDNSVNKITLTIDNSQKGKIVVEDFEDMEVMVKILKEKMAGYQHALTDRN